MAPIVASTEVARPAEETFAYVIDPSTMSEWQEGVVRGHLDTPATRVGSGARPSGGSAAVSAR